MALEQNHTPLFSPFKFTLSKLKTAQQHLKASFKQLLILRDEATQKTQTFAWQIIDTFRLKARQNRPTRLLDRLDVANKQDIHALNKSVASLANQIDLLAQQQGLEEIKLERRHHQRRASTQNIRSARRSESNLATSAHQKTGSFREKRFKQRRHSDTPQLPKH